jgi:hypothetical protein
LKEERNHIIIISNESWMQTLQDSVALSKLLHNFLPWVFFLFTEVLEIDNIKMC